MLGSIDGLLHLYFEWDTVHVYFGYLANYFGDFYFVFYALYFIFICFHL